MTVNDESKSIDANDDRSTRALMVAAIFLMAVVIYLTIVIVKLGKENTDLTAQSNTIIATQMAAGFANRTITVENSYDGMKQVPSWLDRSLFPEEVVYQTEYLNMSENELVYYISISSEYLNPPVKLFSVTSYPPKRSSFELGGCTWNLWEESPDIDPFRIYFYKPSGCSSFENSSMPDKDFLYRMTYCKQENTENMGEIHCIMDNIDLTTDGTYVSFTISREVTQRDIELVKQVLNYFGDYSEYDRFNVNMKYIFKDLN